MLFLPFSLALSPKKWKMYIYKQTETEYFAYHTVVVTHSLCRTISIYKHNILYMHILKESFGWVLYDVKLRWDMVWQRTIVLAFVYARNSLAPVSVATADENWTDPNRIASRFANQMNASIVIRCVAYLAPWNRANWNRRYYCCLSCWCSTSYRLNFLPCNYFDCQNKDDDYHCCVEYKLYARWNTWNETNKSHTKWSYI